MIYIPEYETEIENFVNSINLNDFKNKSFLISGGTGLIGSYLVDALLFDKTLNIKVNLLVRNTEKAKERFTKYNNNKNLNIIQSDITNPIDFSQKVDYVLHLASPTGPANYSKFPSEIMLINFYGCKNMLDICVKNGGRFFFASSSEVYGKSNLPMVETNTGDVDPLDVRSCYNESKRACETLCMSYALEKNIDVVIARFCRVYGPTIKIEDTKAMSQFLNNALNKQDIVLKSTGENKFSYIHASDAVRGILICLERGLPSQCYNISEEKGIMSLKQIAEYIADIASVKVVYKLPSETEKRGYSRAVNSVLDTTKINNLGFYCCTNLKNGIKQTLSILKKIYNK